MRVDVRMKVLEGARKARAANEGEHTFTLLRSSKTMSGTIHRAAARIFLKFSKLSKPGRVLSPKGMNSDGNSKEKSESAKNQEEDQNTNKNCVAKKKRHAQFLEFPKCVFVKVHTKVRRNILVPIDQLKLRVPSEKTLERRAIDRKSEDEGDIIPMNSMEIKKIHYTRTGWDSAFLEPKTRCGIDVYEGLARKADGNYLTSERIILPEKLYQLRNVRRVERQPKPKKTSIKLIFTYSVVLA